ncbi:hypothetical protein KUCAC02_027514 [Chaenocephalus aceratus]|uniref:Uncharacterized protein n=1 Tax=Chaenocephalus aceratus TaxID=36190 RepID=A0ACB9W4L7_CHAAC|nr:hypothetical protein KUCAC02_027514 [Chaenocephalus aceratus]
MEAGSVVRAVFEFLPSVSEELPLFPGDVIEVLSVVDEFWLLGNKDGVTGQFPTTFVEEITIPSSKPGDILYVCINDFNSAEQGNLSLIRGDVELALSGRSRQLSERSAQAQASELPPYALGQARALMSLHAQLNEELDFREGDLIIITGLPEPGWFQGELNGHRGIFPEGFVELQGSIRSPQEPEDYQGELNFDMGDRIHLLGTLEDGWLEGELRGRHGIFPHRFVKIEGDGEKPPEETNVVDASESENDPEWTTYEDHTVWDLDYFERKEEQRRQNENRSTGAQTNNRGQRDGGSRPESQPRRPVAPAQRGPERPKSIPPARPRLPSRPSLPARSHRQSGPSSGPNRHSQRPPKDASPTSKKSGSLGQALLTLAENHRQKKLTRHASVTDADMMMGSAEERQRSRQRGSNGVLPTSFTLDALVTSAGDLEAKLTEQLFEFEKSLTYSDSNVSSSAPDHTSSVDDLSPQSISRHFSIMDFSDESDIMRGTSHSPVSHLLQSISASSSLERRGTLRPPPPRPKVLRPPPPPGYKPARPAPRAPPRFPRQNTTPPNIFYSPDESAMNLLDEVAGRQPEFCDLAAAQEEEIQCQLEAEKELEREMELERQRQKEEEERYQLLLRLQEVEHDMEAYAHTAEELRTMLEEEEEDETARMQAMENLEFCNYTLETLALEQAAATSIGDRQTDYGPLWSETQAVGEACGQVARGTLLHTVRLAREASQQSGRYKDPGDDRRDEHYDDRRRDHYKTRDPYEPRTADQYDREDEDRHKSRDGDRPQSSPETDLGMYAQYPMIQNVRNTLKKRPRHTARNGLSSRTRSWNSGKYTLLKILKYIVAVMIGKKDTSRVLEALVQNGS